MSTGRGLRVVIDSRLRDGEPGGAQQVIAGLACGLSRLKNTRDEEYVFLAWRGHSAWLRPFVSGRCRVVEMPASRLRAAGRVLRRAVSATGALGRRPASPMRVAPPDAAVLALDPGLIHFPLQRAFLTRTPNIYQPHDLQHLHLPEYFPEHVRASRDRAYRTYCAQARTVVVMSRWGRDDIVRHYDLPPEKVVIVPWAPLVAEYPSGGIDAVEQVRRKYALPDRFAYFPAHTYPHKNHLGLLRALRTLRDAGIEVPLVCSGRRNEFYPVIRSEVNRLGLDGDVRFVGFVTPPEVHALYRAARAVLFPTLFEGWGLPLSEALVTGVPCACSAVTCLPEQASGAAVLFDPRNEADIARAVAEVWTNEDTRTRLAARGREVVARLSWDRTAALFRAHYRKAAGRALSPDDLELLEAVPQC